MYVFRAKSCLPCLWLCKYFLRDVVGGEPTDSRILVMLATTRTAVDCGVLTVTCWQMPTAVNAAAAALAATAPLPKSTTNLTTAFRPSPCNVATFGTQLFPVCVLHLYCLGHSQSCKRALFIDNYFSATLQDINIVTIKHWKKITSK